MSPAENSEPITVVALCGSLNSDGYTRKALEVALQGAASAGVRTRLLLLRDFSLCFCGEMPDEQLPQGVRDLRQAIREAQGVILGTPEYHGSYSGVLKNALDLMGFEEFRGKMVGLVGVSGGKMGAFYALASLRNVGRALHAWVIPEQASVPEAWKVFDKDGRPKDEALANRLREVGRQVARFAYLHSSAQSQEFIRAWEESVANPGG